MLNRIENNDLSRFHSFSFCHFSLFLCNHGISHFWIKTLIHQTWLENKVKSVEPDDCIPLIVVYNIKSAKIAFLRFSILYYWIRLNVIGYKSKIGRWIFKWKEQTPGFPNCLRTISNKNLWLPFSESESNFECDETRSFQSHRMLMRCFPHLQNGVVK